MAGPGARQIGPWGRSGHYSDGAERRLTIAAAVFSAGIAALAIRAAGPSFWLWWQWLIVLAVAAELGGGMVAATLPGTKRANHGPGSADWRHLGYALIQLHLPLMALVVPDAMPLRAAWLGYVWLVGGAAILLAVPIRLRLATGLALATIGAVLMARPVAVDGAIGWMPLLLYLKIFAGHLIAPDQR